MSYVDIALGFVVGTFVGIGAALFYLRWKMKRQLGNLEQQMDALMDVSGEMGEMMPGEEMEDAPPEEAAEEPEEEEK